MNLLEKAKSFEKKKLGKEIDKEMLEAAIAYIQGEISIPALAKALNVSSSAANQKVMHVIFQYVRNNPSIFNGKS